MFRYMFKYIFIYIYIIVCRKANNWSKFLCHVLYFIEQLWVRSLRSVWSSNAARITANMDIKIRFPQEFPTQVFGLRYSVFGVNTTSLWTVQPMLEISAHFMHFYIRSVGLYGADTSAFRRINRKHFEMFKCAAGKWWRKSTEEVIRSYEGKEYATYSTAKEV